ncbi:MAG: YciI family protein [Pseudomonadota bacterium]|nr:YciI family protein [Pseudomonadota bacterium]
MLYVIFGHEAPEGSVRRGAVREAHLARLLQLQAGGRLLTAGPLPTAALTESDRFHGSLVIAEFAAPADARAWADAEPYLAAGVFDRVDVWPYRQVLPGSAP